MKFKAVRRPIGDRMDQQNFDDYFNKRYLDQIGYYEAKSGENQLIYRYLQWALIILAALTPALIESLREITMTSGRA